MNENLIGLDYGEHKMALIVAFNFNGKHFLGYNIGQEVFDGQQIGEEGPRNVLNSAQLLQLFTTPGAKIKKKIPRSCSKPDFTSKLCGSVVGRMSKINISK